MRTTYDTDVERLKEAGATHVVTAEAAAAGAITDRVIRNVDSGPDMQAEPNACADGVATRGGER